MTRRFFPGTGLCLVTLLALATVHPARAQVLYGSIVGNP